MARLTGKRRKALPSSAFAYPKQRKYPIYDKAHARNALSRAAQKKTFGTYAHVRAAVSRRFPGIGAKKKSRKSTRTKATSRRR